MLDRCFDAAAQNRRGVADITYVADVFWLVYTLREDLSPACSRDGMVADTAF